MNRTISKEIYERATANNGYITQEDYWKVFTQSEVMGYGLIDGKVFEKDGKHFVGYTIWDSCD